MVSLNQLQEISPRNMVLLVGPPGSGKSMFCQQSALQSLTIDRPVIFVTTEYGPSEAEKALRDKGLGTIAPNLLNFVDAYNETVGLSVSDRPDTIRANCGNLTSLGIAIHKIQKRIGKKDILLVFDSLTSPYLLSGPAVVRFLRLNMSKFVAEGNSVLACFDEGSCKHEDLVGMMSLSNSVVKMRIKDGKKVLSIVKHPEMDPQRIEVAFAKKGEKKLWDPKLFDAGLMRHWWEEALGGTGGKIRSKIGDYVNIFWPNLVFWSGILWDPKRFPAMRYELIKKSGSQISEYIKFSPWHIRILFKLFMPKKLSKVKDSKKLINFFLGKVEQTQSCILEFLDNMSLPDEHYFRVYENFECCGFEGINSMMASYLPPLTAGICEGIEKEERDWNCVETKCIGLGDSYCEFKLVPGEISELKDSLQKDSSLIQKIHDHLIDRLMRFLLEGKPLIERSRLSDDIFICAFSLATVLPAIAGERYRMATRMGGAKSGKKVGENLLKAGIVEDEAMKIIMKFFEDCNIGKITSNKTIRIEENCEGVQTKSFMTSVNEASCYFTTGFLNGFLSTVKNQHVKETKCITMGDPYCEWKFR